jgi:hypothetical protein
MRLHKLDVGVARPERFTVPPEPHAERRWARLFEIKDDPSGAKYGIRDTSIEGTLNFKNLSTCRFGFRALGCLTGADVFKVGDRIIVALGPENTVPRCVVYELVS